MRTRGFTLIELSIVLVIIGLIVGGVLVGQDLIRSAAIRATISQVEQFNTGVNTFYGKYQGLPGDLNYSSALNYGLTAIDAGSEARGSGGAGTGDGNGIIEGNDFGGGAVYPQSLGQFGAETGFFWSDLTYAHGMNINLIPGSFMDSCLYFIPSLGSYNCWVINFRNNSFWFPTARIGGGNYFYVYSRNGFNFYALSVIYNGSFPFIQSNPGLTVTQAYNIDRKTDDGVANTGRVQANYLTENSGTATIAASQSAAAGSYTTTTCFDSGTGNYATNFANGNNLSCALSFQFQ